MKSLLIILALGLSLPNFAQEIAPAINLNVAEFKEKMKVDTSAIILDVRTPEETALGIIEGALELNVLDSLFTQQLQALDTTKTYLVYCRSGRRSLKACEIMIEQGFTHLFNLVGGYTAWIEEE
ncbi:MAG: rhodanese-like domain-containing protein [Saprospiraceae bacterium]